MNNSISKHIAAIIVLPVSVTVLIPLTLSRSFETIPLMQSSGSLKAASILFFIFGLLLMNSTVRLFNNIGKGTLAPWHPTQRLVVEGPYKFCRNPMITGVLCILLAETLWFNKVVFLVWTLSFFMISTVYFIFKEEPDLEKRFGKDYVHYKKHVPRWIPKLKPYRP